LTGDIRDILAKSDAARSLRLEKHVAESFRARHWPANRGVYYLDTETGKQREIDVYSQQLFDKPRKREGIGAPIINMAIYCECKSLHNSNILFSPDEVDEHDNIGVSNYWVGYEHELAGVVDKLASEYALTERRDIRALYDHVVGRAYPGGIAVLAPTHFPPPPVDVIATAFRETKGGRESAEQGKISPAWGAVRSGLSAVDGGLARARYLSLDYVHASLPPYAPEKERVDQTSFFLDAELSRSTYLHPFVLLGAKLWALRDVEVSEVKSARIIVSGIGSETRYVDVVNEDHLDQYMHDMTSHFEAVAKTHIERLWDRIDETGWFPGAASTELLAVLRITEETKED
jgi:hypothetical protein